MNSNIEYIDVDKDDDNDVVLEELDFEFDIDVDVGQNVKNEQQGEQGEIQIDIEENDNDDGDSITVSPMFPKTPLQPQPHQHGSPDIDSFFGSSGDTPIIPKDQQFQPPQPPTSLSTTNDMSMGPPPDTTHIELDDFEFDLDDGVCTPAGSSMTTTHNETPLLPERPIHQNDLDSFIGILSRDTIHKANKSTTPNIGAAVAYTPKHQFFNQVHYNIHTHLIKYNSSLLALLPTISHQPIVSLTISNLLHQHHQRRHLWISSNLGDQQYLESIFSKEAPPESFQVISNQHQSVRSGTLIVYIQRDVLAFMIANNKITVSNYQYIYYDACANDTMLLDEKERFQKLTQGAGSIILLSNQHPSDYSMFWRCFKIENVFTFVMNENLYPRLKDTITLEINGMNVYGVDS
ncbi:hypothetical protein SAMD00019534_052980 [Acytostelium subglobosum LB1]|uniref:hypothetical protein n=1 Tax=Acytostelium subglobosum LB1 TaxID=1410327 RepID=UPI000644CC32|nr:hypothetical protein SAMD00019534_052980 [Acytostelium subglobosum LB1]GAM22123.1 hypothetical protein SAMD00019534_052980 [Acytostelium subglobosum LB1]|eukprot:XP_012755223.1 hypothetical protein SAMD00019534_052980 [Acytostelium subglobosum LB1]